MMWLQHPFRSVVVVLWRSFYFRLLVVWWCHKAMPFSAWVAVNTPLLVCIREQALQVGDLHRAHEVSTLLRGVGEL
jgi:hypothetical protein